MRKTKKQRFRASILAFLLIASMVLGMVPGSAGQVYAKESTSQTSSEEEPGFIDKAVGFFKDTGDKIASFFGAGDEAQPAAAYDETSVVDADTKGSWTGIVKDSTQNIGRIWTDKSVYNSNVTLPGIGDGKDIPITKPEESDFMVGLSVLSSTSNTSVTTSTPLDIVLVLDVSGSMSSNLGTSYVYSETYNIDTSGAWNYYALDSGTGQYVEVDRVKKHWWGEFDHWELNGVTVEPKTSRDDNDPKHIQFYRRNSEKISRINALKDAAGAFVDATAVQNQGINEANQHRLSVVTFSDNGNVAQGLTACNANNAQTIKNTIDELRTGGNTYPGNAMRSAQQALAEARDGAQKVVIFFTDGNPAPAGTNDFNESMANDGVQGALTLKNNKTKIFSIGIFEGADPGNTSTGTNNQFNAYMHAMSSNYPNATAWNQLGERSTDKLEYYYAATSSDELSEIFQHISEEINTGTGYPTETQDGFANKSGHVTFHDQLGDYMQVDSFNKLVLEDMVFENPTIKETAEGVTYTYSGQAGEDKNVSDIVITVTKGTGRVGDTVDVSIPASLLPLRHFKVDVSNNTMTVEDKYPLRLFYNVSLKEDAKKALANPDQRMKDYIAKNKEGGNVYFYSNKFIGNKPGPVEGQTLGDTTATFEPATGNSFYYFTENTMLWLDEQKSQPATSHSAEQGHDTYYYEKTYYELVNGEPKEVTEMVSFRSHPHDEVEDWVGTATDGQLYIKAGAPRLTRIHDLTSSKGDAAVPGTATEVITPNWNDKQAQRNIEVSLGNNGRLAVELPGTLEIKKTVTSEVDAPEKDFTFKLTLKNAGGEALTGEFDAQKFDAQGVASGDPIKVQNDGTVTLKAGESVKIYGLSDGDTYSIEETEIPKGFTAKENPITGTIAGNATVTAEFENTYAVTPAVLDGDSSIHAKKTLTGRDWLDTDSFNIVLTSIENAPLPEASEGITIEGNRAIKTVTKGDKDAPDAFDFGKITFTKPGTYAYNIDEPTVSGDAMIPGIDYSGAVYRVDVVVTDDGEGKLSATSTMKQILDDQGRALDENGGGIEDEDKIAEITNDFNAQSVSWGARARKEYTDYSGAYPLSLAKEKFSFKIETVVDEEYTEAGPLPGGESSYTVSCGTGGQISFGQATFDGTYVGEKFLYKITEVLPKGVNADHLIKDGMKYDATEYYLELSFDSVEGQDGGQIMRVTPKYMKEVNGQREEVSAEDGVVFKNEYRPTPVVVGDDTNAAIKGSKTLNGRAMNADEFSFELTAGNQAAVDGLANNSIVFGTDTESNSMTATAPAADKGAKADFAFGQITFTKPGTYTFNMKEVIPADENKAGGLTYDTHTEVVTVTVTDNNGVLTANTTYDADGAAFVNKYEASHSYSADGGALVTKTLTGRDMKAGEFNFTIEGTGDNKDAADKKLAEADKTFTHYAAKADVPSEMRKLQNVQFTEADAGQTFTYLINEVIPADDKKAGGVTYDQSEFTLAIAVADDGDGTMSTTTTVTRTKAADGTNVNEIVGTYTSAAGIVAVPFVNTYKAAPVIVDTSDTEGNVRLRKVLRGRDWNEGESFAFTMMPQNGAPIPAADEAAGITVDESENVHAVVTAPENGAKDGEAVYFGFGEITYGTAGTYVYTVTEDVPDQKAGGMTYSENTATITVTVTDPGTGNLNAVVTVSGTVSGKRFYNDYAASLRHNAAGGIVTTKTLTGHDMAKQQFTFQVEALAGTDTTAEENAKRIGISNGTTGTYRNDKAAQDGQKITMKTADGNDIEFTTEDIGKTFKYQFSEVKGSQAGYTYDDAVYTVELWVTDDGDGTLTLHTKVNNGEEVVSDEITQVPTVLDFTNSYAASGTLNGAANLAGSKKMDGPWKATGKNLSGFQFTITGGDEATNAAIKAGTVVLPQNATVISDEAGNFKFGDITFKKKGTYTFKVSEVVLAEEDKIPGVTYNAAPVTITVNVTDNDNGTLTAELVEGSPELTFTNTYATTEDATFTPSVVKKVEGLDAKEDFTFKLSAADDATKKAINAKKITGIGTMADPYSAEKTTTGLIQKGKTETVYFDALTFTEAGTYKFTVKEINENAPTGWTYDSHTYGITINVTDVDSVLKAQMKITDPNTNSRIFTNSFAATTTYGEEGGLNVTKTLNGRTLKAEMFDFTIAGQETYTVTAKEANEKLAEADKSFKNAEPGEGGVAVMSKLGAVKFNETDIGKTYQYAVQEIPGKDPKYTYDNVSATVAIQVLEKGGGLYTVTTVTKGEDVETYSSIDEEATAVAPFVNRYTPEIVNVDPGTFAGNVTKVLEGNRDTALEADEFNFQMTITPADETSSMEGVVLPEGANNGTVTAANAANGLVSFGNIQFKAAGTYHVEISEVIPEKKDPNMTYDKHTFSYDIEVTYDASKGELSTKAVEDSKSGSPVFTNIYEADDAKDVANTDKPTTSVNGKVVGVGDQLTYTIDWVNNAVDETTGAPAKAEVTIKDIVPAGTKYVSANNEGAYDEGTNAITWALGEQEAGASGTVSFVVEVLDNAGGTDVRNKAEITVGNNDPKQTNEVTTKVPGKDSVVEDDGELQVGKILTYTISYKNPEEEVATVTIKDIIPEGLDYVDGSASNGATYNEEDRTLTWTFADVQPGTEGMVTFKAKVNESAKTVIDNKATIQIGDNAPTYDTNTDQNEIPKDGNLAISKTIALAEGQETEINKKQTFTFTVELKDAKGSALTNEYAYTVTDGDQKTAEGKIANAGTISLKHGQKATITGLPAGAQYKVTEKAVTGYTTSVNGQVGNAASGTIAAEETAAADFTNTYSVAGSLIGSDALTVTKELVGREWLDTDRFAYALTPADEATATAVNGGFITLPANAGSLEITNASAEHQAAFGDIQFTIAGTFKFHVTEQPSGIAGITDDENMERTVVVKVTDKKDGTLEALVVKGESEDLTFTNTYGAGTGEDDIAAKIPATKKLTGRDMKADEFQFEVVTRKADEKAENFKEEVVAAGTNKAAKADVAGTVTFAGKDDVKLTYTVESLNKAVEAGYAVKEVKEGQSVWTVSYTARELTDKLPGGVKAVEGKTSYGFTIVVTDNNAGALTAEVQAPEGGIAFENAYTTGGTEVDTEPTDATAYFNKVLTGRDWSESDEFTFTIAPQDGAPAPEKTTATVKKADAKAGALVPFGFGKITFTDKDMAGATANEDGTLSKTFTYQITENDIDAEKMPGVTKDSHVATLTITVTDNQQGELSASANMTAENGTFTNTYKSSLDYTALSGLQITKVLNGRDMADGQFTFTVTPKDKDSADKLELTEGATEFTNTAKPAGETDTMDVLAGKNVTFTQEDAGKTFTYTVAEKAGDNEAYAYDDTPRTVTIEVKDNENATLTVTTTVKKGSEVVDTQSVTTGDEGQKKATVAFVNTYNDKPETLGGDGEVKINAKKTLMNRPMVDGEFKFHVKDNKNDTVTSGTNSTDGTITFAPVTYDTDKLIKDAKAGIAAKSVKEGAYVYTYDYKIVEDNSNFADGVTGIHTSHPITVIVTDDGEGNLSIEVVYPEGSENVLTFKNIYGADESAVLNINGHKTLEVESGTNAPDITGKYTFTIEGSGGAPMPKKRTATNDKTGNVDFGAIQYTMEDVFGSEPAPLAAETKEADEAGAEPTDESDKIMPVKSEERTKEFTYTVKESGNVPGVHNDSDKTFKVTVTDNGDGTITVDGPKDFAFEFTNTYRVDPVDYSINTDLTITKELDGRELKEGEFTFELVGEDEKVVSTAQNSADGSVTFGKLTYKVPGTYNYVIREKDDKAGGVEYDSAEHTVVVVVTDNGDGTMTAKAELKSRDGEDVKNAIVFKNSYIAQPASVTLGASKAYTGGELKDGQFTFELKDKDGKVVSKAKNTKEGQIVFETISYDQAGTYEYKISEVNDEQKHVTYDKTVYGVTVTVTDNGEGSLMATVEYDGGKAPVFTNKYSKPAKPAKPEEPKGPTAVKTGDEAPVIPFIILMVATLAIIVTITFIFFRRKRR